MSLLLDYLFLHVRGFVLQESLNSEGHDGKESWLEKVLAVVIAHPGERRCVCADIDLQWSFASQILTIPFTWKIFPSLKKVVSS